MALRAKLHDRGREPTERSNPRYPNGIDIDVRAGASANCVMQLEYPAPRCGFYVITCDLCGTNIALTTAGRRDDPRSVRVACKLTDVSATKH
jgi:hypothetical protein